MSDRTQHIAEDITSILDFLSPGTQAVEEDSPAYLHHKAGQLAQAARRLQAELSVQPLPANPGVSPERHSGNAVIHKGQGMGVSGGLSGLPTILLEMILPVQSLTLAPVDRCAGGCDRAGRRLIGKHRAASRI
jgi:hypothetical protein